MNERAVGSNQWANGLYITLYNQAVDLSFKAISYLVIWIDTKAWGVVLCSLWTYRVCTNCHDHS